MRVRLVGTGVIAALALAGLSACSSTHAGAAAFVGGDRIAEGDVSQYVVPGFTVPTDSSNQEPPRVFALDSMVRTRLMTQLLDKSLGGVPSDAELASLHDQALATAFNIQGTGAEADATVRQVLDQHGVKQSFAPTFVKDAELLLAVIAKTNAQQLSDISNAVKKADIPVSVNARYGAWSPENVSISGPAQLDFVHIGSSTPAAPQP
ncbi:MAG TPA: hypothetical protein VH373_21385 [Jatrophihabitantaceae bacterium]